MDHPKNLKVKDLKLLLCSYFGSEKLKGVPNKVEVVDFATDLFRKYSGKLYRDRRVEGLFQLLKLVTKLVEIWYKYIGF